MLSHQVEEYPADLVRFELHHSMITELESRLQRLPGELSKAVAHYWTTRARQQQKQLENGKSDQGARSAVTGGAQLDGLIGLFAEFIQDAGVPGSCIHFKQALELPGYFRPTKEWDLIVVRDGKLVAVLEAKSHVGPSFGNNFNNRTEEAMGSAVDLWTAFREGAFNRGTPPFLGYFLMVEDCAASRQPVKVQEPHFAVFPEFKKASYLQRYELFCRKLVLERHYTAASFITSRRDDGLTGQYVEPASDLTAVNFLRALYAHVLAFGGADRE